VVRAVVTEHTSETASLLIAKGLNVVLVSRQLGHSNPTVTLGTYAHAARTRTRRATR
jgi:integrase